MPRFNSITGAIALYRRDWFDATRTVYQDCSHADPVDEACAVVLSDGTVIAPRAKVAECAGGGGVAAWEDGIGGGVTVRDSRGRSWPAAGLHRGCGPDGAYALKVLRNSYGPWDVIDTRSRWRLTDGDAHDIQLLGNGQAIWMIGVDDYATWGLPIRIPLEHHYGLRAAWIPEEARYVTLYQRASDGALVCDGRLVAPPSDAYFYPDVEYRDGQVRIVWATTQGDAEAIPLTFTLAELRALPVSEQTPPAIAVPAINRRLAVGWFHFGGDPETAPGNCTLQVDPDMLVRDRATGQALAQYVAAEAAGTVEALDAAIAAAAAARPTLPVIAYWTAGAQRVRVPIGADMVGVEAYCGAAEAPDAFEHRIRAAVAVCPAAVLIAQGYTSNAANTADLASLVPVYARIARDCRNVLGVLTFSSGSRATGWDDEPDAVHDAWRALFASVLGLPVLPARTQPAPRPPAPAPPPPARPPVPPPTSDFQLLTEVMSMTPKTVAVIGPNGLYASVDPTTKRLTFDRTTPGAWESFALEKPDDRGRLQLTSQSAPGLILGEDTTQYGSNDVRKLFALTDEGKRGNYESWFVGKTPHGLIVAMIEYIDQGVQTKPYAGPNLTLVEL